VVSLDTVVRWQHGPATRTGPGNRTGSATGTGSAARTGPATPAADAGADASAPAASEAAPEPAAPKLEDLPGLRAQAHELTELLDLGFRHSEVLERLGTSVHLGVLIAGPAGSGKSSLVRAVAAQVDAPVRTVWAPEVAALADNAAAARLREVASADDGGPWVLLITDLEALAPADDPGPLTTVTRQVIREVLAGGGAVVATTARPEALDPGLRAPDLLSLQLAVPLPDAALRAEQLAVLARPIPLHDDVSLAEVAARTPGFVAADLGALAREAALRAARRHRDEPHPVVTMADFKAALAVVTPSAMAAESTIELGGLTLEDVGDLAEVKEALTEAVLWPVTYPDTFARLGVQPPRGVLLYGPPGCGKTFLVRAIAGSGKANLLSVKGAELLTKWVGESERAVRELFRRARQAAPSLLFLDEVDALAPVRGQASDGGTTDRVVAALLTELDGVEALRDVVVVAATNRPDLVDPALLRPGRLERLVYVPPPDAEARAEILRAASRDVPLAEEVDLDALGAELDGFSAADCAALVREAALVAMRETMDAEAVTAAHVTAARQRVSASLDPAQVAALAAYAESR
jgi:transitional endoplasmic reticulum ATPase